MDADELFKEGIKLRNSGKLDEAIAVFLSMVNLFLREPKLEVVYTVMAGICSDKEDYQNATKYFAQAVELNPNYELASLGLYVTLAELEKDEEAVLELARYLEHNPAHQYLITLQELLDGLKEGYMTNYQELIEGLARRNGLL